MHLVFRASKATGRSSFHHPRNRTRMHVVIQNVAARHGVRVLGCELNGNHAHLLIQGKSRVLLRAFFRHLPQAVMFLITGARKGNPQGRFFDQTLFTRIVYWGKDYRQTKDYLWKNLMEAMGLPAAEIRAWREGWAEMRKLISKELSRPERKFGPYPTHNLDLFSRKDSNARRA